MADAFEIGAAVGVGLLAARSGVLGGAAEEQADRIPVPTLGGGGGTEPIVIPTGGQTSAPDLSGFGNAFSSAFTALGQQRQRGGMDPSALAESYSMIIESVQNQTERVTDPNADGSTRGDGGGADDPTSPADLFGNLDLDLPGREDLPGAGGLDLFSNVPRPDLNLGLTDGGPSGTSPGATDLQQRNDPSGFDLQDLAGEGDLGTGLAVLGESGVAAGSTVNDVVQGSADIVGDPSGRGGGVLGFSYDAGQTVGKAVRDVSSVFEMNGSQSTSRGSPGGVTDGTLERERQINERNRDRGGSGGSGDGLDLFSGLGPITVPGVTGGI